MKIRSFSYLQFHMNHSVSLVTLKYFLSFRHRGPLTIRAEEDGQIGEVI